MQQAPDYYPDPANYELRRYISGSDFPCFRLYHPNKGQERNFALAEFNHFELYRQL